MIYSVKLTNSVTGQSEQLNADSGTYIIDSIDWGMPSVSFNQYRVPFQVGETLDSVVIGTRVISIVGYVISDLMSSASAWDEYLAESEREIEEKKLVLDKLINVNQDLILNVGEYVIKGRPTQYPKYSSNEVENNEVLCLFNLEIMCYSPMFTKGVKSYIMLGVSKMFHFPLTIPRNKGVIFGIKTKTQALIVSNDGDSETGLEIVIEARGAVDNPKLYNIQTRETIGFDGLSLDINDRLTINTNIGEESAVHYISDERRERSVIGLMTTDSKLMRLPQGVSFLMYDLENPTLRNAEIYVKFSEQYANIRGM